MAGVAQFAFAAVAIVALILAVISLPHGHPAAAPSSLAVALLCFVGFMVARIWGLAVEILAKLNQIAASRPQPQQPTGKPSQTPKPSRAP